MPKRARAIRRRSMGRERGALAAGLGGTLVSLLLLPAPGAAIGPYPTLGSCRVFPDPPPSLSPRRARASPPAAAPPAPPPTARPDEAGGKQGGTEARARRVGGQTLAHIDGRGAHRHRADARSR